eukprot:m.205784 g.205784  ORF g.205784 m.205784 type:complete len:66 (+) comp15418_c0_seq3:97-294(+)
MVSYKLIAVAAFGLLGGASVGFKAAYEMRVTTKETQVESLRRILEEKQHELAATRGGSQGTEPVE